MGRMSMFLVFIAVAGCATYSQLFINATGEIVPCSATGQGIFGMAVASNAVTDCSRNMRAAGYLELERAGVVGLTLAESPVDRHPRILKVANPSPAYHSGVDPGDLLIEIDGQEVYSIQDAKTLLFGEAGTSVLIHFRRADFDTTYSMNRVPYPTVYGRLVGGISR